MLKRLIYTLNQMRKHRHALAVANQQARHGHAAQISAQQLKKQGINVLVLDFDGILAYHGANRPLPVMQHWLRECVQVFGTKNIFILSNKPMLQRRAYFQTHGIRFITGVAKKPYPDGLHAIQRLTQQPAQAIALVDDRLLTGVLASVIAGSRPVYVPQAYADFRQRPVKETFFLTLRWAERWFFRR